MRRATVIILCMIVFTLQCVSSNVKYNTKSRWGLSKEQYDSIVYKRYRKYVVVYKDGKCALYNRRNKNFITEFLYKSLDYGRKRKSLSDGMVYDFTYTIESGRKGGFVIKDNSIIDGWMSPK